MEKMSMCAANPEMTLSFTCCRCTSSSWAWPHSVFYWPRCCGKPQLPSVCHGQTGAPVSEGTRMSSNSQSKTRVQESRRLGQFCDCPVGSKTRCSAGAVSFVHLHKPLLPCLGISQHNNVLHPTDHAQYKCNAAFYKSPWLFCLDVPFFLKLMLTFYGYFISSWFFGKKKLESFLFIVQL